jgi:5-methylcytosine-specific restriction protein A
MIIPLLPLDDRLDKTQEEAYAESLPEGAKTRITVNRYERNRANREACVSFYGPKCQACGFDFAKVYGSIGEGYIEVHHKTPLSEIGREYLVNPIKDLIPICANCHAIIHRESPALTIEDLKAILRKTDIV